MAKTKRDVVRVTIAMAPKVNMFFDEMANEAGTTKSGCMSLVLKLYMDGVNITNAKNDIASYVKDLVLERAREDAELAPKKP